MDVRDVERERVDQALDLVTLYDIHELVLRQATEQSNQQTKLRVVGPSQHQSC